MTDHDLLPSEIEFHRQSDSQIYAFALTHEHDRPVYVRDDGKVKLLNVDGHGWVVMDTASRTINSRPWVSIAEACGDRPPAATGLSLKNGKSNIYELVYADKNE